jgi:hypothetical protein
MVSPGASVVSANAATPVMETSIPAAAKIRIRLVVIPRIALFLSPPGPFPHNDRQGIIAS